MHDNFMKFVYENDGRNFKQGSRQEEVEKLAFQGDVARIENALKELKYDIRKLTERIERLENVGYKTDVYGNYYLPE